MSADLSLERGLPQDTEAERIILGALLVSPELYDAVAVALQSEDFMLESHRRIWSRMVELAKRGEQINRLTLIGELNRQGQLASVGGMTYLANLDDGMPELVNVDSYLRIVKEHSQLRKTIFAARKIIDRCLTGDMAGDVLGWADETISELRTSGNARSSFEGLDYALQTWGMSGLFARERIEGIPSPWKALNGFLLGGGFAPGQLIVVGGNPGSGKTALAACIAAHLVRNRKRVRFVSLEMDMASILRRMICIIGGLNQQEIFREGMTQSQKEVVRGAWSELYGVDGGDLAVWQDPSASVLALRAELRKQAAKKPVDLVIVDYLQLIEPETKLGGKNRAEKIGEISRGLKVLAMELKCPVIALSQLSRESSKENRRPQLSDLRDSGSIEQDADVVLFPWAPHASPGVQMPSSVDYELIIAKQRNGPIGWVPLVFERRYARFIALNQTEEADFEQTNFTM